MLNYVNPTNQILININDFKHCYCCCGILAKLTRATAIGAQLIWGWGWSSWGCSGCGWSQIASSCSSWTQSTSSGWLGGGVAGSRGSRDNGNSGSMSFSTTYACRRAASWIVACRGGGSRSGRSFSDSDKSTTTTCCCSGAGSSSSADNTQTGGSGCGAG